MDPLLELDGAKVAAVSDIVSGFENENMGFLSFTCLKNLLEMHFTQMSISLPGMQRQVF